MLQTRLKVGTAVKGSMMAVVGSGITSISLSLIVWNPRMLEPSNGTPSENISSFNSRTGTLKCCQDPGRSVNLRSTIFAPFSLANRRTSSGVLSVIVYSSLLYLGVVAGMIGLHCLRCLANLHNIHVSGTALYRAFYTFTYHKLLIAVMLQTLYPKVGTWLLCILYKSKCFQ